MYYKNCIDKFDNKYNYYAKYNTQDKEINYDDWSHFSPFAKFATDSEKQQLFDALAKEGKHWDAEKKQIVDLKPKYEFKQEVDIGDYSDWEMIDGKHYCPDCYEVEVIDGVYNVKVK